ncbi:hypothetical protein SODALDRAFT_328975 [Sodiomyces alkalinus F11]|uniref:Uncharacterized protein n=1 Tax=Sodiomyces alkalinus (strain CBS 110278 / VKM F-3762 / F11) TaxID=1314773 RepID=A0A3N2PMG4_SODAK|nr:hypothetical protein SODALDRAFT_328975 [Sodiomyces alkalinus F11]ROT35604.1 hypothetical protein SODALDRAFT_328975 [Sodiomyces alkalinus F11]
MPIGRYTRTTRVGHVLVKYPTRPCSATDIRRGLASMLVQSCSSKISIRRPGYLKFRADREKYYRANQPSANEHLVPCLLNWHQPAATNSQSRGRFCHTPQVFWACLVSVVRIPNHLHDLVTSLPYTHLGKRHRQHPNFVSASAFSARGIGKVRCISVGRYPYTWFIWAFFWCVLSCVAMVARAHNIQGVPYLRVTRYRTVFEPKGKEKK